MPQKSDSALSQRLSKGDAQSNAIRTYDERKAAEQALQCTAIKHRFSPRPRMAATAAPSQATVPLRPRSSSTTATTAAASAIS
ncbi:hypothetical protein LP419_35290 [Massilia sp. H-1]|nr:hypothetical protein LP419_35290 [Massilia sp. H-1]